MIGKPHQIMIFKCLVRFVTTWNIVYIGVFKLIFLTNLFAGQVFLIIECARLYLLNLEKCIFTADTSIILCKYTINVPGIHFKIFWEMSCQFLSNSILPTLTPTKKVLNSKEFRNVALADFLVSKYLSSSTIFLLQSLLASIDATI